MSEKVIVTLVGGGFTLLTAIVTILLQNYISRSQPRNSTGSLPPAPDFNKRHTKNRNFSAPYLAATTFVSLMIFIGTTLITFFIQKTPPMSQGSTPVLLLGGTVLLLLFLAWSDALFPLFARQVVFQLKILAIWAGIKIAFIIQYREDCLNPLRYRDWFCSKMGLSVYLDFFFNGWKIWVLMMVIGSISVEVISSVRRH